MCKNSDSRESANGSVYLLSPAIIRPADAYSCRQRITSVILWLIRVCAGAPGSPGALGLAETQCAGRKTPIRLMQASDPTGPSGPECMTGFRPIN
jgi:hypothetical protein